MLEELYMQDLANAMRMPEEVLPAGKVTVSAPEPEMAGMDKAFVGTRLNVPKPGQPTQQDREKMAVGLLDTLAGALRGAAAQTIGLPGDIRSILDMINQEGAEKYLGQRSFATTEEILKDTSVRIPGTQIDVPFPPVLKEGVPNRAERQGAVDVAQEVGTFLPAPGVPEAVIQGGRLVGKAIKATKNMPVGMSTQAVGQGMDELGFYSAAKQAVDAIQQPKGTGAQFLAQISKTPGVKPDEIKWTGLDEFLQSKKSVSKVEVQEYLDKNRVEIKEVQLGGGYKAMETELNKQGYDLNVDMDGDWSIFKNNEYVEFDELPQDLQKFVMDNQPAKTETKFSKYTLPGGENYREILLTLPSKNPEFDPKNIGRLNDLSNKTRSPAEDAEYKALAQRYDASLRGETSPEFKSQHFDQPNILAHIRVNDRVIDGKKTLFVEEVQSDWHQAGRKKGYNTPEKRAADQKKLDALDAEREQLRVEQARLEELAKPFTDEGKDAPADILDKWNMVSNRLNNLQREYAPIANLMKTGSGVPDAPFKTTWSDLSMKRVIQMASEGGYDRIAFTTGKTQAERFDLSKQINEVYYKKNSDGTYKVEAVGKDSRTYLGENYSPEQLEENIGKELAKKIVEDQGKNIERSDLKSLSGVDLQVGGEGMKGFYDDILPKFLDKYAKKWGAKTGVTEMPVGKGKPTQYADFEEYSKAPSQSNVSVNYIDVTPKMRESVVTKGQPMFAIGAGGAGAAATQEENK